MTIEEATAAERRVARLRLIVFVAALAAVFGSIAATGSLPSAERIRDAGDDVGAIGPIAFVPASIALSCMFVPGPVLAGGAGLLFGTALGTPVALTAAVLGACTQCLIARYAAGRQIQAILPDRVRRIDEFLERRGFLAVLYVRLAPGIPYTLANYGAGLTRLKLRDLAAGTAVGAAPRTFAYVALGGNLTDLGRPEAVIAIVLLVVLAIGGVAAGALGLGAEAARGAPREEERRRLRRVAVLRVVALAAALAAAFLIARLAGLDLSAEGIEDWGEDAGTLGAVLFVPVAVALSCAFVPFPAIAGGAGLVFGTALGTALAVLAVGLAAVTQMLIARYLAREQVTALAGPRTARANEFLERRGFFAVLYARLVPGIPFVALNYAAGLTRLRVRDMGLGTAIAKAPRVFAYAALGGSLSDLGRPEARIAIAVLVAMGILGAVMARRQIRAERPA
jgi:uncharacterized membrane protein YdjX (TVP38/TMEM64 family)